MTQSEENNHDIKTIEAEIAGYEATLGETMLEIKKLKCFQEEVFQAMRDQTPYKDNDRDMALLGRALVETGDILQNRLSRKLSVSRTIDTARRELGQTLLSFDYAQHAERLNISALIPGGE